MLKTIITFTALLLIVSAIGYLFFPSNMLAVVGIHSNQQMNFLLRAYGVALVSLVPSVWAARSFTDSPISHAVITGLVSYVFLGSVVDFYAYTQSIVNTASIPSIAFRILLGAAILVLVRKETTNK